MADKSKEETTHQSSSGKSEWLQLSEKFERWGRAGIAISIGLSAAGLFCRLADQGKVNVPVLTGLVLNRGNAPTPSPEPPQEN